MQKVRIDRWLWSVRIFKSRSKATEACKSNKIRVGDNFVKPSFMLERDEILHVKKDGFNLTFKVLDLLEKRVSAPIARKCYTNLTPEAELNKYKDWFVGKAGAEFREKGLGRPSKKERRELDIFKDDFFENE